MKRNFLSLACMCVGFFAFPLAAEDFEFDVPVKLGKLDSAFTQGKVSCEVRGLRSTGRDNPVVGSGQSLFAISGGSYDGTVSVRFNANRPISQPTDGRTYVCTLSLVAGSNVGALCTIDPLTGQGGSKIASWMKITPGFKGCAMGTLPGIKN